MSQKNIYKNRGFYGFFNSSFSAIGSQIVFNIVKIHILSNDKKILEKTEKNDFGNNIINGGVAGIAASIFSHPFDVIKIHQQTNDPFIPSLKKNGPLLFLQRVF